MWKTAEIKPIPKTKVQCSVGDFRPISLTSILGKTYEKVVKSHLLNELCGKLDPHQYAFTSQRSCEHALAEVLYHAYINADKSNTVKILAIDFSKAFDRVNHQLLINKLISFGISTQLLAVLCSFLQDRKIFCTVNNMSTSHAPIYGSVPQGAVLSPLLFNIMTDDLRPPNENYSIIKFADDTTIVKGTSSHDNLHNEISYIEAWASMNNMVINPTKSQIMVVGGKNSDSNIKYNINNQLIDIVDNLKLLGLTINNELNWKDHIKACTKKCNIQLQNLKSLSKLGLPSEDLLYLYTSTVRPTLEYCSSLLTGLSSEENNMLEHIQKRGLYITNSNSKSIDSLSKRREKSLKQLMYKILLSSDHPLNKYITLRTHQRKGTTMAVLPKLNKSRSQKCFFYIGLKLLLN